MTLLFNPAMHHVIYNNNHGHHGPWTHTDTNISICVLIVNIILMITSGIYGIYRGKTWLFDPKPIDLIFNPGEVGMTYFLSYMILCAQALIWLGVGIHHMIF